MPMLFSPTIGAAVTAGYWFLWVRCPACRTTNAIDLRALDRHRDAAVISLIHAVVPLMPSEGALCRARAASRTSIAECGSRTRGGCLACDRIVRCCSLAECSIIACGQASYTEPLMANEALINLLDWCKRERENLQCQFDALKAGRFKTHSNDGSGWKDTTQDSIERVEENIRELSKLIYKYEAARFER